MVAHYNIYFNAEQKLESCVSNLAKKHKDDFLVQIADDNELRDHNELCNKIDDASDGRCIWNISKI